MMAPLAWIFLVGAGAVVAGSAGLSQTPPPAPPPPATRAATQPVKQSPDGVLKLLAIDAKVIGQRARIEKKGNNPHNIGYWTNVNDRAVWQAVIERPGRYAVDVEYSLDKRAEGARYVIEFNK